MKKHVAYGLLLLFLSVTSSIQFFHTDDVLQVNDTCPACHFQNSTHNVGPYDIGSCFQPALFLLEMLSTDEVADFHQVVLDNPRSRAPPRV